MPPPKKNKGTFLKRHKKNFSKKEVLHSSIKAPHPRQPQKNRSKGRNSFLWRLSRWGLLAVLWLILICAGFLVFFAYDLPNLEDLKPGMRRPSIVFKSVEGVVLCTYGESQGKTYDLKDLSSFLPKAVIAIEDRRFYFHKGVDLVGLIRAAWTNMRHKAIVQGGSTLTQQLAKNLFLTPERSLKRKVQELMLAVWLERKFTKDQILTIYLNRVYLGSGTYGIGAAAHKYFGKSAKKLTLFESALLAGLLKAPSTHAPTLNPEKAHKRAEVVLQAMVEEGYITPWQKTEALVEILTPKLPDGKIEGVRYFCDWVLKELPKFVENLSFQDLVITTTLDPKLQKLADKVIEESLKKSKDFDGLQVALLSVSSDGAVRAMIGGRSYEKSQFNRAAQALRQSGSLFKVIVYLACLEGGFSMNDVVSDGPIRIGSWSPKNFQWESRGKISLKEAFGYSVNTSAVRLARKIGLTAIQKSARQLGITSSIPYNLSVALGTAEVSLLEMTSAFAVLANGGYGVEPFGILRIEDGSGKVLYDRRQKEKKRVISERVARAMQAMLHYVVTQGTGKAAAVPGLWIAGKTGTTQEKQDAWFIGFTEHLVTGIWVGIDSNQDASSYKKKKRQTGGGLPAQLFQKFMGEISKDLGKR